MMIFFFFSFSTKRRRRRYGLFATNTCVNLKRTIVRYICGEHAYRIGINIIVNEGLIGSEKMDLYEEDESKVKKKISKKMSLVFTLIYDK